MGVVIILNYSNEESFLAHNYLLLQYQNKEKNLIFPQIHTFYIFIVKLFKTSTIESGNFKNLTPRNNHIKSL